jgi:hypothetical protein
VELEPHRRHQLSRRPGRRARARGGPGADLGLAEFAPLDLDTLPAGERQWWRAGAVPLDRNVLAALVAMALVAAVVAELAAELLVAPLDLDVLAAVSGIALVAAVPTSNHGTLATGRTRGGRRARPRWRCWS